MRVQRSLYWVLLTYVAHDIIWSIFVFFCFFVFFKSVYCFCLFFAFAFVFCVFYFVFFAFNIFYIKGNYRIARTFTELRNDLLESKNMEPI